MMMTTAVVMSVIYDMDSREQVSISCNTGQHHPDRLVWALDMQRFNFNNTDDGW